MPFSTLDLLEISIAGAQERHDNWVLNPEMTDVIQAVCKEIDNFRHEEDYDVFTNIDKAGDGVVTLNDPSTGDHVRSWVFKEVFIVE